MTMTNAMWTNGGDEEPVRRSSADEAPPARPMFSWYAQGFSDPLGDRLLLFDNTSGEPLELLRLCPQLSRVSAVEALVRERAARLEPFADARFARVCRVDRLPDPGGGLAVVSNGTQGRRLSEILHLAEAHHLQPSGEIVQRLVSDVVAAVARFHEIGRDVAHGALGPERLVVTPDGQLLVTEYVLGSALAQVALDRANFWRALRLALPVDPALAAFDQRTDVVQTGTIALALLLGRRLREDEYPARLAELVAEAGDRLVLGGWGRLAEPFLNWLLRMLQIDHGGAIANGLDARRALAEVVPMDEDAQFGGAAIDAFIRACSGAKRALAATDATAGSEPPPLPAALAPVPLSPATTGDDAARRALPPGNTLRLAEDTGRATLDPPGGGSRIERPDAAVPLPPRAMFGDALDGRTDGASGAAFHRWKQAGLILLVVVAVAETLFIGGRAILGRQPVVPSTGMLSIDSVPAQAKVVVDGKTVGATPIKLALAAGRHMLEVSAGDRRRSITVNTVAGSTVSQLLELPSASKESGRLRVVTAPPGGRVLVDGQPRGATPVDVEGLAAGNHEVVIEGRQGSVRQTVNVEANSTASVFVPLPGAGAPAPGWLSIDSPIELSVYEDAEFLGTSKSARIMLPAGRHQLQLVAEGVGFKTTNDVQVPVGKTATLEVAVPEGKMDINALPWAEVSIDNRRVGETPLGGVRVPIGRHVVTFRHPQLGDRTVECLVTLQSPARVSVDLRK